MHRILVSLFLGLLLACSTVGLKNIAVQQTDGTTSVLLAAGGSRPPVPK
jgi:hypothetical protein